MQLPSLPSLPKVTLPSMPSMPRLPEVQLPHLPTQPPAAADVAHALQDGAAAAAAAAQQLPNAFAAQLASLQTLLESEPGGGASALGLQPHFGTKAFEAAVAHLAAALSAAVGARSALPPILQLPTAAFDGRLAGVAATISAATSPDALAAAWAAASEQIAAALPTGAAAGLAAGAAAFAQQQAAASAQLESALLAAEQLRAAAAALPETGFGGLDFATLCIVAAGTLGAVAASVPPADYEASAAGSSGNADPALTHEYDPDAVAAYFSRRPLAVATRAAQLAREAAALGVALGADFATGRVKQNEGARARQLRGAIERLGPAYVKVAQVSLCFCMVESTGLPGLLGSVLV